MEDCTSCKVISTAALISSGAYLAYGATFWTGSRVNKRFLYPFSAGKNLCYCLLLMRVMLPLVLMTAGVVNWIIRSRHENDPRENNGN